MPVSNTTVETAAARKLRMQYAGGVVKHLGLSMYRGAVPVLAELISNSWDADATRVDVTVPFDQPFTGKTIVVSDNGHGMGWGDVQDGYLVVGRDRRKATGKDRSPNGRMVMGRKGLGKLAGFGIAEIVEVRTVKDAWITHFRMDFTQMTQGGAVELIAPYEPDIIADHQIDEDDGTTVTLSGLHLQRRVLEEPFRESMSRRFSIVGAQFDVKINGRSLAGQVPTDLQFRFPADGLNDEYVDGVGQVQWWAGFTEKPIKVEDARGISVVVRGKMAQTPFFFGITGGVHGQHGMQYMMGEVFADQLDADKDLVATDRQALVWSEPTAASLMQWGQGKIHDLLRDWLAKREKANEEKLEGIVNELDQTVGERIGRLSPSEQSEARQVLRKLASIESITDEPDRAKELIDLVLRAFEDSSFFQLLKVLKETNETERDEITRLVTELDIFETVKMAEVVRARVGVIQKFKEMIDQDVPEKPDMQDFLHLHPWLIDPEWQVVEHERRLEKMLVDRFNLDPDGVDPNRKRVDFFCIGTRGRFLVVEVKRPAQPIGKAECIQAMDYVGYLREQAPTTEGRPNHYEGYLVGHHLTPDGKTWAKNAENSGIYVKTWQELLDTAERTHKEFLDVIKQRAPEDPRVRRVTAGQGDEAAGAAE